jgi:16S rRNA (guanine527-N7)-methyltransferase
MQNDFECQLHDGAEQLGLKLSPDQLTKLISHLHLLIKWNATYNLTSINDPGRIITHHLLDSLSIWRHLAGRTGIDVGSGAGLPGIPLAISFPDKQMTLLDSNGKRCRFLTQAKIELALANVSVVHMRAENHVGDQYDMVFSRAYGSLDRVASDMVHLLAPRGTMLAMRGKLDEQELSGLPKTIKVLTVDRLPVPFLEEERNLVIMTRAEDTVEQ